MTDDINAQPDYGDEPPFACGGTPGHAGKHRYLIDWNGQGDLAEPKPARELAAAMGETRELRTLVAEILESYEATDARGPATRVQIAKWRKRAGIGD